jgi:hypothetical protein
VINMARFSCRCGFVIEMAPQFGGSIASVSHLHRRVAPSRSAEVVSVVRMEEIADPNPGESPPPVKRRDKRHTLSDAGMRISHPREAEASRT